MVVAPVVMVGAVPARVKVDPVNVMPVASLIPFKVVAWPRVIVCAVPPRKKATSELVKVKAVAAVVPVMVVPVPASTHCSVVKSQVTGPVAPAPPRLLFWSRKTLAARAVGGGPTLRRAAATKRHAREINLDLEVRRIIDVKG